MNFLGNYTEINMLIMFMVTNHSMDFGGKYTYLKLINYGYLLHIFYSVSYCSLLLLNTKLFGSNCCITNRNC